MPKKKPTKTSALAGAAETDIEMIEAKTSTDDVPNVQVQEAQPQLEPESISSTTGEPLKNTRGKRGDGDYVQLCVHIPRELRKQFRHAVVENDSDNSAFIEMLIRDYVAKHSKK